jgi:hypothetical protein
VLTPDARTVAAKYSRTIWFTDVFRSNAILRAARNKSSSIVSVKLLATGPVWHITRVVRWGHPMPLIYGILCIGPTMKNFHLPLPDHTYAQLRAEADIEHLLDSGQETR